MARTTRNTFRPGFENLESRDCLSATLANGTLSIIGGTLIDKVSITLNDQADTITVVENGGTPQPFASSAVTDILVDLKASNDELTFKLAGNAGITRAKNLHFDLGAASDKATIDLANDAGGLALIQAKLIVDVKGGIGFDTTDIRLGKIENVRVDVVVDGGNQADSTTVKMLGNLVNADVEISNIAEDTIASINDGQDTVKVEASGIKINKDSKLDIGLVGGQDRDTLDVIYSGELDGLLFVRMNGGRDKDIVRAKITLDSESDGALDAIVRGGGTNRDLVSLLLIDNSNNEVNILNAQQLQD